MGMNMGFFPCRYHLLLNAGEGQRSSVVSLCDSLRPVFPPSLLIKVNSHVSNRQTRRCVFFLLTIGPGIYTAEALPTTLPFIKFYEF